jgi:hypothetical protein
VHGLVAQVALAGVLVDGDGGQAGRQRQHQESVLWLDRYVDVPRLVPSVNDRIGMDQHDRIPLASSVVASPE